jgi:hypothetical protein
LSALANGSSQVDHKVKRLQEMRNVTAGNMDHYVEVQRDAAAITLQRHFRGFIARKRYTQEREGKMSATELKEHAAATVLQKSAANVFYLVGLGFGGCGFVASGRFCLEVLRPVACAV